LAEQGSWALPAIGGGKNNPDRLSHDSGISPFAVAGILRLRQCSSDGSTTVRWPFAMLARLRDLKGKTGAQLFLIAL